MKINFQFPIFQRGFTLIELMVVVVIIGVVLGTFANAATGLNRRGRDSQRRTDIQNIQSALQQYYADEHQFPEAAAFNLILGSGGAFAGPSGKIYLTSTPTESSQATPYCYLPQIAQGVTGCSNVPNSTTKCEYYQLFAQLEDPPAGATPLTCGGVTTYNFSAHSP